MVVLTAGFILQSITIKKHISLMQKVEFRGFSCISATYYSYVSVCVRVLLVCISVCSPFVSVRYPYVVRLLLPVCFPYLSVCCPCVSVCYPMLSVRYPYVVRMYRYVTRMLSVCFSYVVRMLLVCTLVYPWGVGVLLSVCYQFVPVCCFSEDRLPHGINNSFTFLKRSE